jgi:hypothetical protein
MNLLCWYYKEYKSTSYTRDSYTRYYYVFKEESCFRYEAIRFTPGLYSEAIQYYIDIHETELLPSDKIEEVEYKLICHILQHWIKSNYYKNYLTDYPWFYRKIINHVFIKGIE